MNKNAFVYFTATICICAGSFLDAAAENHSLSTTQTHITGELTIKGTPVKTVGQRIEVGHRAPDFTALDGKFQTVGLSQFQGRPVLISSVPSLDTPVCSLQTQRFNEALSGLPEDVALVTISMDLPFAQKRFCTSEKIERMHVWSDSARREFGTRYGVLIRERGLLARAVFVVGRDGKLVYREVVKEVSEHPDYEAALKAIRDASSDSTAVKPSKKRPHK